MRRHKAKATVRARSNAPKDVASQIKAIQQGQGSYSHTKKLPLAVDVERRGWFSRRILVTTLERMWYMDAATFIDIDPGFDSDLASVPRLLWFVISPWDLVLESLFHDAGYKAQVRRRRVVDQTMLSMMEDLGKPWLIRWTVYLGVRVGGWVAWRNHARELAAQTESAQKDAEP